MNGGTGQDKLTERVRRVWPGLGAVRLLPSWPAVAGLALVALLAAGLAGWALLRAQPRAVSVPLPPQAVASARPASPKLLVVEVTGAVRRPGIVRLAPGSRVVDALAAAGGLRPGTPPGSVNLAALLSDGQQVVVGAPAAAPGAPPGSAPTGGPLDLNAATLAQLDALPGVGPVLAQRILDWRTAHGRFNKVDDLGEVGGIGPRKLADLRARVRV